MISYLKKYVGIYIRNILSVLFIPIITLYCLYSRFKLKNKNKLVWGVEPLINIKYWSEAVNSDIYPSITLVKELYGINNKEDFDLYYPDLFNERLRSQKIINFFGPYLAFIFIIKNTFVFHTSYNGGPLGGTVLEAFEPFFLKLANVRTVIIPYGSDVFMYSKITSPTIREGFLRSYPEAAINEPAITRRVSRWTRHADIILMGFTTDGIGRWDIPVGNMLSIDTKLFKNTSRNSTQNGEDGAVTIVHAPNHTGVKGTDIIENAIQSLQQEGLKINYLRLQGYKNSQVRSILSEADIFIDQIILSGYGMAAIEAMASGLPVIASLEYKPETELFRRFSFLLQCPIISCSPETLLEQLRILVKRPEVRLSLGNTSRQYVDKFHSYQAAQYLFHNIYSFLGNKMPAELRDLYHPLKSDYTRENFIENEYLYENHLVDK